MTQGWHNQTFNMAPYAGQTVRVEFLVHQDGFGDDTSMYVDDVALLTACSTATPATATSTSTVPTVTASRTPAEPPSATATSTSTRTGTPLYTPQK